MANRHEEMPDTNSNRPFALLSYRKKEKLKGFVIDNAHSNADRCSV